VVWVNKAGGTGAGLVGRIITTAATIRSPLALQPCRAEGKALSPCANQGSPHCAKLKHIAASPVPVLFSSLRDTSRAYFHSVSIPSPLTPLRLDTRHISECFTVSEGTLPLPTQHQHGHDCVPMVAPRRRIEFHSDPTPENRRIWPTVPLHTYLVATAPTVELAVSFRLDTRACSSRECWSGVVFGGSSLP
jgi:hypothetical protein